MMRLDKFLCEMNIGSRQDVKKIIRAGKITVNGLPSLKPEMKIEEMTDKVVYNDTVLAYQPFQYYMLNKPSGVITATSDKKEKTVLDLIKEPIKKDLFPVGRLDKDTEGLLLLTNDGALAHRLLSPRFHVDKVYLAKVHGEATAQMIQIFENGIDIGTFNEPELTKPAALQILESGADSLVRITIREGKYHQVKRMCQRVGLEVYYLKREQMGPICLDKTLKGGEYRVLSGKEVQLLKEI